MNSSCAISFYRNDLQVTKLWKRQCPVKNCKARLEKVPFQRYKGKMRFLPFCPEHGLRIHSSGFVYYNGPAKDDLIIATKRNLAFHGDYYVSNFLNKGNKMESGRLCYESSEDAVSFNVFTELLAKPDALRKLASHITQRRIEENVDLYLWGGKIGLKNSTFEQYRPLLEVRHHLERDIGRFATEPDIMLVVPNKTVICIEAKFGSKNPVAKDEINPEGEKPRGKEGLIERYCLRNEIIACEDIFDFKNVTGIFYEQLFRNVVFAASMAHLEGGADWYVVNLRNQHVMNLKRGGPESSPVMRNIRAILRPKYKKRFTHLTWEEIYTSVIKEDQRLADLSWYLKNKSLGCGRAFNVL